MGRTQSYRAALVEAGASIEEWREHEVVAHFGDVQAEHAALVDGVVVADRSERETIVAEGTDVVPLLQGLVLGDVYKLAEEGRGQLNAAVNVKGRYVTELRLLHVPELLLIDLEPGMVEAGALSHFKRQVINEDARFKDRSEASSKLIVAGPRAGATLSELGEWPASGAASGGTGGQPADLELYCGTWGELGGEEVIVQRLPDFGVDAWELIVDAGRAEALWSALTEVATPIGTEALEIARIEHGTPRWGVELDEKIIPLEAGMSWMVSFDKGCYLGQEIIARLDTLGTPGKELRAIDLGEAEPPQVGEEIRSGEKKVGEVRAAIHSPRAGRTIVHAYLKRGHNEAGIDVTIGGLEGRVEMPGFALIGSDQGR